jgi:hypothetical protein
LHYILKKCWDGRGCPEPPFAPIKWCKWKNERGWLELPFAAKKMIEMWEWKGVPRIIFNYNRFVETRKELL